MKIQIKRPYREFSYLFEATVIFNNILNGYHTDLYCTVLECEEDSDFILIETVSTDATILKILKGVIPEDIFVEVVTKINEKKRKEGAAISDYVSIREYIRKDDIKAVVDHLHKETYVFEED